MLTQTPFDNLHFLPLNDLKEHLESFDCWCNPNSKEDFPPYLIIHNSADRREDYEFDNPNNRLIKI